MCFHNCFLEESLSCCGLFVYAGVTCLCAVNREPLRTGGPTNRHLAKCSRCTRPTIPCCASLSPLSPPRVPETNQITCSSSSSAWTRGRQATALTADSGQSTVTFKVTGEVHRGLLQVQQSPSCGQNKTLKNRVLNVRRLKGEVLCQRKGNLLNDKLINGTIFLEGCNFNYIKNVRMSKMHTIIILVELWLMEIMNVFTVPVTVVLSIWFLFITTISTVQTSLFVFAQVAVHARVVKQHCFLMAQRESCGTVTARETMTEHNAHTDQLHEFQVSGQQLMLRRVTLNWVVHF